MLVVFSPIFAVNTKIICSYNFVAPLRELVSVRIKFHKFPEFCLVSQKLVPANIISKLPILRIREIGNSKNFEYLNHSNQVSVNTFFNLIRTDTTKNLLNLIFEKYLKVSS